MSVKRLLVAVALLALVVGCTSKGGDYQSQNVTTVDLSKGNYRVLKGSATGDSTGFKLFCCIPFSAPSYAKAMNELRSQAPMEGKATAVTNVTQDKTRLWLLLFSLDTLTVTGDIIEFTDAPQPAAAPAAS